MSTTRLALNCLFLLLTVNIILKIFSISIVEFEQVHVSWVLSSLMIFIDLFIISNNVLNL